MTLFLPFDPFLPFDLFRPVLAHFDTIFTLVLTHFVPFVYWATSVLIVENYSRPGLVVD